ncbi:class I SAM-dependent methyltransferase [Pedobacter sp. BS3]|uniref:class I SAM-dependent methyltransferase n=1 Tax=Pedobacter sp. BS3 TaxID=2567937 RepID=UPI0011EF4518|nr:class I SAM-dependent methyltransferase [Pedobacter sp. BS3]TZF84732.1 class I SAM-dependent methyltransferase [Pedobacter sp. BS3]
MKGEYNNYDNAAWFYDRLSALVFGKALRMAERYALSYIPAGATVLIAGGGTGRVLEDIALIHPSGLTIIYVELSAKMIAHARKRQTGANRIVFVNQPVDTYIPEEKVDVIITNFLFDNFSLFYAEQVFNRLNACLKHHGKWFYTDFQIVGNSFWQRVLLRMMYALFRLLCRVQACKLPGMKQFFEKYSYRQVSRDVFFKGFIEAMVYEKY